MSDNSSANEMPRNKSERHTIKFDFTAYTRLYHHLSKKAIDPFQKSVAFLRCMKQRATSPIRIELKNGI